MPPADIASLNLTLLCTSLLAAVLAGALLAIERFARPPWARRAPGVFAAALIAVALVACCLDRAMWVAAGCGGLAIVFLVIWPVSFEAARKQLSRLLTPTFVWASVLVASMIAARFLAAHALQSVGTSAEPPVVDLEDVPIERFEAVTDRGRLVRLFHFKVHSTADEVERFLESAEKDRLQMIRLSEANPASNCHGWVFTGGQFGIRDGDISKLLADNGYVAIEQPHEGDLAIYLDGEKITHSGVVRIAGRGTPLVIESKWGPFGVYLHAIEKQPFAGVCKFYRSPRAGHQLVIRSVPAAGDAAQSAPQVKMHSQR